VARGEAADEDFADDDDSFVEEDGGCLDVFDGGKFGV